MKEIFQTLISYFDGFIQGLRSISVSIDQFLLIVITLLFFMSIFRIISHIISGEYLSSRLGDDNVHSLKKIIHFFLYITLAGIILEILGFSFINVIKFKLIRTEKISFSLYHVIILMMIIFFTRITIYAFQIIVMNRTGSDRASAARGKSLMQIIKYMIYVTAFAVFVESLGFSITFFIASISALLIGLGLGIQHLFDDLVSGIILLFDGSIKIDDIIEIEGKIVGKVMNIGLRTTSIMTRDSVVMIIPNSSFTSGKIINWSHNREKTRFDISVGVKYGSDITKVEDIMIKSAAAHTLVSQKPKPFVMLDNFGESSLQFKLMFWTLESFYVEEIQSRIRIKIYEDFSREGIEIPFNQMDVHVKK